MNWHAYSDSKPELSNQITESRQGRQLIQLTPMSFNQRQDDEVNCLGSWEVTSVESQLTPDSVAYEGTEKSRPASNRKCSLTQLGVT